MILSNYEIRKRLFAVKGSQDFDRIRQLFRDCKWAEIGKNILIYPFTEESLQPSCYELRTGRSAFSFAKNIELEIKDGILCEPMEYVAVASEEFVGLPIDVMGLIQTRATLLSLGFSSVSNKIDPGYHGVVTIGLFNQSKRTLRLKFGTPMCSLTMLEVKNPQIGYSGQHAGSVKVFRPT